jgi:hypothetical protein
MRASTSLTKEKERERDEEKKIRARERMKESERGIEMTASKAINSVRSIRIDGMSG